MIGQRTTPQSKRHLSSNISDNTSSNSKNNSNNNNKNNAAGATTPLHHHHHLNSIRRRFDDDDEYDENKKDGKHYQNKKGHRRSCRENLLVYFLAKPQFLVMMTIFGFMSMGSLCVFVFRTQKLVLFNDAQQQQQQQSSSLSSLRSSFSSSTSSTTSRLSLTDRVLYQPLTSLPSVSNQHRYAAAAVASSSQRVLIHNDNDVTAGYTTTTTTTTTVKPRVVGCYWPKDYDNELLVTEQQQQQSQITQKAPKQPEIMVPLITERLDANLIRSLTHRSLYVLRIEIKAQMHLENSKDYMDGEPDPFEEGDCVAQYEWQKMTFSTCNTVHEQALTALLRPTIRGSSSNTSTTARKGSDGDQVKFLAYGYWRDVWMVRDADWEPLALKTIRYEHDFVQRNYDRHRRDAVAMEHLTSSPNVISIYGFCGNSGIFEFASGGSLEDAIWYSNEPEWNSTEKLIVAYQMASGLADLHNIDKEGVASIAHTDITPSQFVFVNKVGRFLLNDFNRCRFIRWNQKTEQTCPFHVGNNPGTVSFNSFMFL